MKTEYNSAKTKAAFPRFTRTVSYEVHCGVVRRRLSQNLIAIVTVGIKCECEYLLLCLR